MNRLNGDVSDQSRAQQSMFTAHCTEYKSCFQLLMIQIRGINRVMQGTVAHTVLGRGGELLVMQLNIGWRCFLTHSRTNHTIKKSPNLFCRGRLIRALLGELVVGLVESLQLLLGVFPFLLSHSERQMTDREAETVIRG